MSQRNLYVLRKNAALWQIVLRCSGKVQFSSLSKARCNDWLNTQFPISLNVIKLKGSGYNDKHPID
jgi:hypothetical protein